MIVLAASSTSAVAKGLSLNWFDAVFVVVLGFGLFRGRRNGLSKELLPVLQWIAVVIVCGMGYPTVGEWCIRYLKWGKAIADVAGYLAVALMIFGIFAFLKNHFAERLTKNDSFKSVEYYIGMPAGMVRFACMLFAVVALAYAPRYTKQELDAEKAADKAYFGGGIMSGNFFPKFHDIQDAIFIQSATGHFIKDHFRMLLVDTTRFDVKHVKPAPRTGNY